MLQSSVSRASRFHRGGVRRALIFGVWATALNASADNVGQRSGTVTSPLDCVVTAGARSFDLAEIGGGAGALSVTSTEAGSFVYTFSACGDVPALSAGATCISAPRSAVFQEAGGPCYSLGAFSSRSVAATQRGIDIVFTGGDRCGADGVLRSTTLIVECSDVPTPVVVRAGHGKTQCAYEVVIRARAGCARECERNTSGAICGGAARGICSVDGAKGPARCRCITGQTGEACGLKVTYNTESGYNNGGLLSLMTGHVPSEVFLVWGIIVTASFRSTLYTIFRRRLCCQSLLIYILAIGMMYFVAFESPSKVATLQSITRPAPLSFQSELADTCLPPQPLFVIYSNRDVWVPYTVKSFIVMLETLKTRYGWLEYFPRSREPREDAVSMEANMLRDFGRAPDVLLIFHYNVHEMKVVDRKRYPRVLLNVTKYMSVFDDLPRNPGPTFFSAGDVDWLSLADADLLLPTYEYLMVRAQAIMHVPRLWMPHSALPMFEMPFNSVPRCIILLVGHVDAIDYPMRAAIQRRIDDGDKRFERFKDPGWQPGPSLSHVDMFATALHANLAAIFCSNRHHYAVSKVMEVPATGALLLFTDDLNDALEALGFVDGVHWVSYNASSLDATVDWVLDPRNRARVDAIRAKGQALAHARHRTDARVDAIHAAALELARVKREGGKPNLTSVARFPNYADWARKDPRSAEYYAGTSEYPI